MWSAVRVTSRQYIKDRSARSGLGKYLVTARAVHMSPFAANIDDGSVRLCLLPSMDLRAATPLKAALDDALGHTLPLVVDAGPVERMSTACIQILIAFVAAAGKAGLGVTFRQPS